LGGVIKQLCQSREFPILIPILESEKLAIDVAALPLQEHDSTLMTVDIVDFIEDEFCFDFINAFCFYSVLNCVFDDLQSDLGSNEVLPALLFVQFRQKLLDSLEDGEMKRAVLALIDALECGDDEVGVLIALISVALIQFLEDELEVPDCLLVHLQLLVHLTDVFN
jgi:hypothetical protein